jgi:tape measure domain-containing protein
MKPVLIEFLMKDGVSGGIDNIRTKAELLDSSLKRMAATVGTAFTLSKAIEFGQVMMGVRGQIESFQISFETLIGDTGKANAFFGALKDLAAGTPLQLDDLARNAQTMLGFGIETEKVIPILRQIGDVTMGNSERFNAMSLAFAQMSAVGRLTGQDLLQMVNAGFNPLTTLAEQSGKSVGQLRDEMSAGAISAEQIAQAFAGATAAGGKFNGMLEKQALGYNGVKAKYDGAVQDMLNGMGEASEGVIKQGLEVATSLVRNYEAVGQALGVLIAAYGTYKAALVTISVIEKQRLAFNKLTLEYIPLETALRKGATAATIQEAAATRALNAMKQNLIATAKNLAKAITPNPYALAAVAVAGLAYGIYKLVTSQTEAEKAQKRLSEAEREAEQASLGEERALARLKGELDGASKGTDEYGRIKKSIIANYGKYYDGLAAEIEKVGLLQTTYDKLTASIRQSFAARQYDSFIKGEQQELDKAVSKNLGKIQDKMIKELGDEAGMKYYSKVRQAVINGNGVKLNSVNEVVSGLDEETKKALDKLSYKGGGLYDITRRPVEESIREIQGAYKLFEDIDKKARNRFGIEDAPHPEAGPAAPGSSAQAAVTKNKKYWEDQKKAAETALDAMDAAKEGTAEWVAETKKIAAAQAQLDKYSIKGGSRGAGGGRSIPSSANATGANELKAQAEERQRRIEEYTATLMAQQKQSAFDIEQARIDGMEEGVEKEKAAIALKYAELEEENRLREERWLKDLQAKRELEFENAHPNWKKEGLSLPAVTADDKEFAGQKEILRQYTAAAVEYKKNAEEKLYKDLLGKYQTYEQQRAEINRRFDEERRQIESSTAAETLKEAAIAELENKRKEAAKSVNDDEVAAMQKASGLLVELFGDASQRSVSEINRIREEAGQLVAYLQQTADKDIVPRFGFTADQLKALKASPQEIKAIEDAVRKLYSQGVKKNPFAALAAELKNLFKTSEGGEPEKVAAKLAKIGEAAAEAAGMIGGMAAKLSELFAAAGSDSLSEAMSGLQDAMSSVSNIGKGFAEGGVAGGIGAAIGEVASWATKAFEASARHKAALKQVMNEAIAQQRAYNLLLMEQNLEYEKADTIFGSDTYAKAANAINLLREAAADLNKELAGSDEQKKNLYGGTFGGVKELLDRNAALKKAYAGLADIEVKTGHQKTGLFGWGKGKDTYSSILEVYPDLIGANGKFNDSLAQTILQTRTLSDEDKAALQGMISLAEAAEEAFEQVCNYLANIFGELGNTMSDALADAFRNGTDAAEKFTESVAGMLEELAEQMIYTVTIAPYLQKAQEDMLGVMNNENLTDAQKFNSYVGILDSLTDSVLAQQGTYNSLLEQYRKMAADKGISLWEPDSKTQSGKSGAYEAASQESITRLEGLYSSMLEHEISIDRGVENLAASMGAALSHLQRIEENTASLGGIKTAIEEMQADISTIKRDGIRTR